MADLRPTLVTPGVNTNGALSAATEAFSNLQKQMNAPFDRKLEADIRDQNRQDKLNEVNYQHGRDAIMDQRYKDEKLLEQKKYNQTLAEKQANSEYLLAKTNPTALGSSTAQREYDAALSANGLSDQDRADIKAALGDNYIKDRSAGVVNSALTNPLVSGDTVYNYDNSEKDNKYKQDSLKATVDHNKAMERNAAAQLALQKREYDDKIEEKRAKSSASLVNPNVATTDDGVYVKQNSKVDGKTVDISKMDAQEKEQYLKERNDVSNNYEVKIMNELLAKQEKYKNTTGSLNSTVSENALKKDFAENQNNHKDEILVEKGDSGSVTKYTKNQLELQKKEADLFRKLDTATSNYELKEIQSDLDQTKYDLLKENAKHDYDSYKKLNSYERENIGKLVTNATSNAEKSVLNQYKNTDSKYSSDSRYGVDNIKKENSIMSPSEVEFTVSKQVKEELRKQNPKMSESALNDAASSRGKEARAEQQAIINKKKEANTDMAKTVAELNAHGRELEYMATNDRLKEIDQELGKSTSSYSSFLNTSEAKERLLKLKEEKSNLESKLDLLSLYKVK